MLKIFAQLPSSAAPETHVFTFTSPTLARAEADAIKSALGTAIQDVKATTGPGTPANSGDGVGGLSAAMAIASAVSTSMHDSTSVNDLYDDARLKVDAELQQSLLKADPSLQKLFMELLRTKPESIGNSQFTAQFWSSRIHLLRAHAIEKSQRRGAYNVLSTIRARTEENVTRLSISKEQIQLIFNQHPLVRQVYDESVPKINESEFWSRFFQSRLFKKLKGEKILDSDPLDRVIDKYLGRDDDPDRNKRLKSFHAPHIIDLEGNEVNHSQRQGNQPDLTMRPASVDKVPIIRTLNNTSERIMAHAASADADSAEPIGEDEETMNELALRDLRGDAAENRIILNIRNQQQFFAEGRGNGINAGTTAVAKRNPMAALAVLQSDLNNSINSSSGGMDLEHAIGVDENSDSETDEYGSKKSHVGSRSNLAAATKQILEIISQRRSESDDLSMSKTGLPNAHITTSGLTADLFDRVKLTHATTTEFLHNFWTAFISGDPDRAGEVANLAESLERAMQRIQAVASDAEIERSKMIEDKRKEVQDVYQATGRKLRFRPEAIRGGAQAVNEMLGQTIKAVTLALAEYKKALKAESADTGV